MKIVTIIACIFLSSPTFCQNSYYFSNPLPTEEKKVSTVDKKWFGEYNDSERSLSYVFSEEGITAVSTQVSSISKKSVRESSKYTIKGDYIFGVVEGDSLQCVYEKGYYHFGIRNRDAVISSYSSAKLTRINDREYILNFDENGKFLPVKIVFSNGKMTMSDFDYEPDQNAFSFIESQRKTTENSQNIIVLSPTQEEFDQLSSKFFVERSTFSLITE
ncbi:MAG: hypothetical protein HWE22_08260 [Flavobacteriales bacterium]|nr:hypothetical protein [Flavobacteriales bacterium]